VTDLDVLRRCCRRRASSPTRLPEVVVRAARERRIDVAGVRGCADAILIAELARAGAPVIAVAEDGDAAAALAKDVKFLLGSARADDDEMSDADDVLVLSTSESSPYADVIPIDGPR